MLKGEMEGHMDEALIGAATEAIEEAGESPHVSFEHGGNYYLASIVPLDKETLEALGPVHGYYLYKQN